MNKKPIILAFVSILLTATLGLNPEVAAVIFANEHLDDFFNGVTGTAPKPIGRESLQETGVSNNVQVSGITTSRPYPGPMCCVNKYAGMS